MTSVYRVKQTHELGMYDLDGVTLSGVIKLFTDLKKRFPDGIIYLDYGYDEIDFAVEWTRAETDAETTARLKRATKNRLEYALKFAADAEEKEKNELAELKRLQEKYGDK